MALGTDPLRDDPNPSLSPWKNRFQQMGITPFNVPNLSFLLYLSLKTH
jgi:hypothetical protein